MPLAFRIMVLEPRWKHARVVTKGKTFSWCPRMSNPNRTAWENFPATDPVPSKTRKERLCFKGISSKFSSCANLVSMNPKAEAPLSIKAAKEFHFIGITNSTTNNKVA